MLNGELKSKSYFNKFSFIDVSNCVINALRLAFNTQKEDIIDRLLVYKYDSNIEEEIQSETVWGNFLLNNGYKKIPIPIKVGTKRITLNEFIKNLEFTENEKVIVRLGAHIVYADHNGYYDENNTHENDIVYYFYIFGGDDG